jgi:hypothetical protein
MYLIIQSNASGDLQGPIKEGKRVVDSSQKPEKKMRMNTRGEEK